MKTIVYAGTVTAKVAQAPFQFAPSKPGVLGLPRFVNGSNRGTNRWGGAGDNGAGYYGLRFLYSSISPWDKNGALGTSRFVQFAGGTINSFGIFEQDNSLANPAQFNPVVLTGDGYTNSYNGAHSAFNRYDYSIQPGLGQSPVIRYPHAFPALSFQNISSPFQVPPTGTSFEPTSTGVIGFANNFVPVDVFGNEHVANFNITFAGGTPPPVLLGGMACGNSPSLNGFPYQPVLVPQALGTKAVCILEWSGSYVSTANPSGPFILWAQNFSASGVLVNTDSAITGQGPFCGSNLYFDAHPSGGSYLGRCPCEIMRLSDPTDNAALTGGLGINEGNTIMTPQGVFVIWINGYPYYLAISADLTKYWRIAFQTNTAAAQNAVTLANSTTGFGVDAEGNFWFGGNILTNGIPILYSTLGLGSTVSIGALPDIPFFGMNCRAMGGFAGQVWEG